MVYFYVWKLLVNFFSKFFWVFSNFLYSWFHCIGDFNLHYNLQWLFWWKFVCPCVFGFIGKYLILFHRGLKCNTYYHIFGYKIHVYISKELFHIHGLQTTKDKKITFLKYTIWITLGFLEFSMVQCTVVSHLSMQLEPPRFVRT